MTPSHLTQAQTARCLGVSPQTVGRLTFHGQPLEAERFYGTMMVPMYRIKAFMEANNGRLATGNDGKASQDRHTA